MAGAVPVKELRPDHSTQDDALRVGFARAVITPELPVHLSGYGDRIGVATEVHDDLEVRALVASAGGEILCLLALDLMALSDDWATPIRDAVADALGVSRAAVVTQTIHTHSAPSTLTGTDLLGWVVPDGYRVPLAAACVRAAVEARVASEPATIAFARLPLPEGLSFNRRGHPYSPTFAVVDVKRDDGSRIGMIANIGVHPVVLGPRNLYLSSDWVGACRRYVEEHAGGQVLFLQGCAGDVDPEGRCLDGGANDWFAAVEVAGAALGAAVLGALAETEPVDGRTGVASQRVLSLPVEGSGLAALSGKDGSLEVELVEWDIGGVRLLTVPGEGFAAFAAQVLARRTGPVLLAGLAPHWLGYLPVPFGDGYEEGLSYGAPAVTAILDAVADGPDR